MKKSYLLLSFLILFQSCFSYKSVDYNRIPIEKKQKKITKIVLFISGLIFISMIFGTILSGD